MNCPRKKTIPNGRQCPMTLVSFSQVKKIAANVKGVTVMYLAAEPSVKHKQICEYDRTEKTCCIIPPENYAHFYVNGTKNGYEKHYIILLVNCENIRKTLDFTDKFLNTAAYLRLQNKNPQLYIFIFTHDGTRMCMGVVSPTDWDTKIKDEFELFTKGKNIQIPKITSNVVGRNMEIFTICSTESNEPYTFKIA